MLEKWDLMDDVALEEVEHGPEREGRRGRRRAGRSSSVPARGDTAVSRVREYELWYPERERIRLAQVEMERREDAAKARVVLAEAQSQMLQPIGPDKPVVEKKKVRDRMATPRLVVSQPASGDDDEWLTAAGGRSTTTSMASTGSFPPLFDDSDEEPSSGEVLGRGGEPARVEADLRRSSSTTHSRAAGNCASPLSTSRASKH